MRRRLATLAVIPLLVSLASPGLAQTAPALAEAQAIWEAFWARVAAGDLDGAYRYVHTSRRGFPLQHSVPELRAMARQLQHCRLLPDPLPTGGEDILFQVRCEHEGETAETQVGFQRDLDGAWRLTVI